MSFRRLENIKSAHPQLARLIDALKDYVAAEVGEGRTRIVPALAAVPLGLSEAETLGLLMLLEEAGLVLHGYEIVCRDNDAVLKKVSELSEVEDTLPIYCELCDEEHDADSVRVELVFEVTDASRRSFEKDAA